MPITQLSITDFRNHRALRLEPGEGFVLLSGPNGAGKTNILEAVSLLVPGRGLRRARYQDMARDGGPGGFTVFAGLGELEIGTGTSPDAPARRQVRINGASASAGDLAEWLSVVWLTPAMDRLFTESASGRRRFLDRLVLALHPGHAAHAARYELAMRERNRLLSDDRPADPDWLDAIELRMAEHGAALAQARDDLIARLGEALETEPEGAFARPAIALDRKGEAEPDAMTRQWRGGRAIDRAAGRTLAGPHRTDLVVHHAAKDRPAAHCSTGEQKAMLLALILSHSELVAASTGQRPILLLDEVAAHLDPVRRATLFDRLGARAGQVWMTGTEEGLFDGIGAHASRFAIGGRSTTSPDEQG